MASADTTHHRARASTLRRVLASPFVAAAMVFSLVTVVCAVAGWMLETAQDEIVARQFRTRADHIANALDERLLAVEHALTGAARLASVNPKVTAADWAYYVDGMQSPALQEAGAPAIAFAPRVARDALGPFVAERRQDSPTFDVWPAGDRDQYFPIVFTRDIAHPGGRAFRPPVGFDGYSDPVRRDAIQRAAATGKPAYSTQVRLVGIQQGSGHPTHEDEPAVLLYAPASRPTQRADPTHGTRTVSGMAIAALRLRRLIVDLTTPSESIEVGLVVPGGEVVRLWDARGRRNDPPGPAVTIPLRHGGGAWAVSVAALPAFGMSIRTVRGGVVAGAGTLAAVALGALTLLAQLQRRRARSDLRRSEERFRLIADNVSDLISLFDARGRRVYSSPSYRSLFGADQPPTAAIVLERIHPEDHEAVRQAFLATLADGADRRVEFRVKSEDGGYRRLESQCSAIHNALGKTEGVIVVSRDVTERLKTQEALRQLAHFDALTGLPNRALFVDRVSQALAQARRIRSLIAILFVDLDNFKDINDTDGHAAGDRMLCDVARQLEHTLREGDSVARQGGDEFIVLLQNLRTPEDAGSVARKILDTFRDRDPHGAGSRVVTASIGISVYPEDGDTTEVLVKNADLAMYEAKAAGKNEYRFFRDEMRAALRRRAEIGNRIRHALAAHEFDLHYQPILDLRSGEVAGAEALIRWEHPERGRLAPAEFIPFAEENGSIVEIGEWVLRQACLQGQAWARAMPGHRIAVNVSGRQFHRRDFVAMVADVLGETGFDSRCLELELTESVLLRDLAETNRTLLALRGLGVRVAIDDFGTGYSNLSYLRRFGVDRLKIDRTFVDDIVADGNDLAIIRAIVSLARNFRTDVTAEGVETAEQRQLLQAEGCTELQGYLIGRPVDAREYARRWVHGPWPVRHEHRTLEPTATATRGG